MKVQYILLINPSFISCFFNFVCLIACFLKYTHTIAFSRMPAQHRLRRNTNLSSKVFHCVPLQSKAVVTGLSMGSFQRKKVN